MLPIIYFLSLVLITAAIDPIIILHGGAGDINDDRVVKKKEGMRQAIRIGYDILLRYDNAVDAVEKTVNSLEDHSAFNAGHGSVLTKSGQIEMDAIIINGTDLTAGAVGAVRNIANPVSLARMIKDTTEHVFIVGNEAREYALKQGIPYTPTDDLIVSNALSGRRSSDYDVGTVGAVAINSKGEIAAATSTGGMTGKLDGRVGDTPIVGGGTLADDDSCGISATGFGEAFIRFRVASKIAALIDTGKNPSEAILEVLNAMTAKIPGTDGGAIAISKNGTVGIQWNSNQMAWAYAQNYEIHYGVNRGEDIQEPYIKQAPNTGNDAGSLRTRN